MEYTRKSYKYTVTLTPPTVTVAAIDYASLHDYSVVIDPKQHTNVGTPERLYTMLIDGFEDKRADCKLTLTTATESISLELKVSCYMFEVKISEVMLITEEPSEIQLLTRKIERLNKKLADQDARLQMLEDSLSITQRRTDRLGIWERFVPCVINGVHTIKTLWQPGDSAYKDCTIKIERDSMYVDDHKVFEYWAGRHTDRYSIDDLMRSCKPTTLIVNDNTIVESINPWIPGGPQDTMDYLRKLVFVGIKIDAKYLRFNGLLELTLRKCTLSNSDALRNLESLKVLNVTNDIDLSALYAGGKVPFTINIIQ